MKDDAYIGRTMLRMELSGKRKRGRPKGRFMDAMSEDMSMVEVTEKDADYMTERRCKIRFGDPCRENNNNNNNFI